LVSEVKMLFDEGEVEAPPIKSFSYFDYKIFQKADKTSAKIDKAV
jgi:hypothetical protein